ncbi:MAG: hypothetical protein U0796_02890 [Gemmatales bacterium]
MKASLLVLASTAAAAVVALCAGHAFGYREDVACAAGGLVGLVVSNALLPHVRKSADPNDIRLARTASIPLIAVYVLIPVVSFAFIGWLTGHLHDHGSKAGALSGSLGGAILAVLVPLVRGESFLALKKGVLVFIVFVLIAMLGAVVWVMYFTEMRYWYELSKVLGFSDLVLPGVVVLNLTMS